MASFIQNGSEITIWIWGIASKQAQNPKQYFQIKISFLNLKLQVCQLTKTALFITAPVKKAYLAVHFTKRCFFVNLLTEKFWV